MMTRCCTVCAHVCTERKFRHDALFGHGELVCVSEIREHAAYLHHGGMGSTQHVTSIGQGKSSSRQQHPVHHVQPSPPVLIRCVPICQKKTLEKKDPLVLEVIRAKAEIHEFWRTEPRAHTHTHTSWRRENGKEGENQGHQKPVKRQENSLDDSFSFWVLVCWHKTTFFP